jgi:hypothetical protein
MSIDFITSIDTTSNESMCNSKNRNKAEHHYLEQGRITWLTCNKVDKMTYVGAARALTHHDEGVAVNMTVCSFYVSTSYIMNCYSSWCTSKLSVLLYFLLFIIFSPISSRFFSSIWKYYYDERLIICNPIQDAIFNMFCI